MKENDYNKKIEAIVYEHETVPGKELTSVQTEYENRRKAYDARIQEISDDKRKLDEEERNIISSYSTKKGQADTELAVKNEEYNKIKYDLEKQTADFEQAIVNQRKDQILHDSSWSCI